MANQATQNPVTKVITGKVRLSYAHLFTPKPNQSGELKYSVCLLIPKSDTATIKKVKAACEAVKQTQAAKWGGKVPPNLKMPLRDGDVDRPDDEVYAGHYFVNANCNQAPGIVDRQCNPIMDQNEVYSGCYARASINFFAFNNSGNKGIGCGLNNVQKLADGEPLSGRTRAEDDFEALDDEDDFLG